jgi:hypothetical protein
MLNFKLESGQLITAVCGSPKAVEGGLNPSVTIVLPAERATGI